jgi:hypothetical protein
LLNYSSGNIPKLRSLLQAVEEAVKDLDSASKKIGRITLNINMPETDFAKAAFVRHALEVQNVFIRYDLELLKTDITSILGELNKKK